MAEVIKNNIKFYPLLDMYVHLDNKIDAKYYHHLIADFVKLWGADIHFITDNVEKYNNLVDLLNYVKELPINTYCFLDGIIKQEFNYINENTCKTLFNNGVNALALIINEDLVEKLSYLETIKMVLGVGIKLETYFKLTKDNFASIDKIISFNDKYGIKMCVVDIDKNVAEEKKIFNQDYEKVLKYLLNISETGEVRISIAECPYLNMIKDTKFKNVIGGCIGGINSCMITSEGNITPCIYLPNIIAGNITKDSFEMIWNNSNIFYQLRDRSNIKGKCSKCDYLQCCGGCRAESFFKTKDLFHEDPNCFLSI